MPVRRCRRCSSWRCRGLTNFFKRPTTRGKRQRPQSLAGNIPLAVATRAVGTGLEPAQCGVHSRQRLPSHLQESEIEIVAGLGINAIVSVAEARVIVTRSHISHQIGEADGELPAPFFEQRAQLRGATRRRP